MFFLRPRDTVTLNPPSCPTQAPPGSAHLKLLRLMQQTHFLPMSPQICPRHPPKYPQLRSWTHGRPPSAHPFPLVHCEAPPFSLGVLHPSSPASSQPSPPSSPCPRGASRPYSCLLPSRLYLVFRFCKAMGSHPSITSKPFRESLLFRRQSRLPAWLSSPCAFPRPTATPPSPPSPPRWTLRSRLMKFLQFLP